MLARLSCCVVLSFACFVFSVEANLFWGPYEKVYCYTDRYQWWPQKRRAHLSLMPQLSLFNLLKMCECELS